MGAGVLLSGVLLAANPSHAAEPEPLVKEARKAAKALGLRLKERLAKVIKADGPVKAITECNTVAIPESRKVSLATGFDVNRTSLKLRNPGNAPDSWEMAVLEQFEARQAKGESLRRMEYSEVVEAEGQKYFRYMKPIGTERLCLTCHGGHLRPEIGTALDGLYPADNARGFKIGDIRGAFTVSKPVYD